MPNEHSTVRVGSMQLDWLLRLAVAGALVGHGAYGAVLARASWYAYFGALGFSERTVESTGLLRIVGGAEIALGVITLVFPAPALLLFISAWKVFTEILRPATGEPFWEFIERASNMLAPLVLLYVRGWPTALPRWLGLQSPSKKRQSAVAPRFGARSARRGTSRTRER
jgi:hypothetical protein